MAEYTLVLTDQHLQTISTALGDAPFKFAAPVISEINRQLVDQQPKTDAAPEHPGGHEEANPAKP